MQFRVGDTVQNKLTREEGLVVRIADATGDNPAGYIVLVTVNPRWGMSPQEALWPESQVKK